MNESFLNKDCSPAAVGQSSMCSSSIISWSQTCKPQSPKEPFEADNRDGILALATFVLGFFFARWVLFSWQGWGVTLFSLGYCAAFTIYLVKKGLHIPWTGWFWSAIVLLTGFSYSLWTDNGLEPWRSLLLFFSAVYWVVCATGRPILGRTSNLMILDSLNGILGIPFKNISCQYKSLSFMSRNRKAEVGQIASIALGLGLTLIVSLMVLPLLLKADSGGFSRLTDGISVYLQKLSLVVYLFDIILAVPIAAYLFGLLAGSVHNRGCNLFEKDNTLNAVARLRKLPAATVYTLVGLLCLLYLTFIGCQLPYFFLAFMGKLPEGWQVYSEYARSGFFELCRIAAINLSVLTVANLFNKTPGRDSKLLKILNSLLAVLTLVLIATALSKMLLYIGAYGLSIRRILPCFFMIFLAVVCCGIIALQKWQFSIVRLSAGVGVVMLCTLCLINPDALVASYNSERYLSGTLDSFDASILYQSGPAGVGPALKVYESTADPVLRAELRDYLRVQRQQAVEFAGQAEDNLQWAHARQKINSCLQ